MHYRLIQLFILGCYLIHLSESMFIYNLTNSNKILCHSCKGNDCERIADDADNVVACNKNTQLCWAGFIDRQPYRTCSSRYCTPSGISLESDIRIEMCCHSNLCNNIPLSWSVWRKWYDKTSTARPTTVPTTTEKPTIRPTTKKVTTVGAQLYFVNEIVDGKKPSSQNDNKEEQEVAISSRLQFNASDPASFGINWERVPYDTDFSNRLVSMSKLLILIIPVLLILLF